MIVWAIVGHKDLDHRLSIHGYLLVPLFNSIHGPCYRVIRRILDSIGIFAWIYEFFFIFLMIYEGLKTVHVFLYLAIEILWILAVIWSKTKILSRSNLWKVITISWLTQCIIQLKITVACGLHMISIELHPQIGRWPIRIWRIKNRHGNTFI